MANRDMVGYEGYVCCITRMIVKLDCIAELDNGEDYRGPLAIQKEWMMLLKGNE